MKNLVLIGGGGHCLSCIDVIENLKTFKIIGVVDNKVNKLINYPFFLDDKNIDSIRKSTNYAFVTVGQIKDPNKRIQIFSELKKLKFKIPIIISKTSYLSKKVKIDEGTIILNYASINAYSEIGCNCIINTGAIIEHESTIGNNCHISTGAILNGNVNIGDNSFIGSNTVIKEGVKIGKNCIIGAGLFLKKNVKDFEIVK